MSKINPPTGRQKIIAIVGPTASGKSDLAIKIAQKFNGEVISADSRQVYRGMDVGTGKISKREQKIVPHHLIDIASPKKQFTADNFKKLGQKAIDDILSQGKVPIIVGGTGFYIDVLLGRISITEVPPNKKLHAQLGKLTVEHLFKMLQKLDFKRAETIESKNKRRLVRALEIILTTGKPVPKPVVSSKYQVVWIGLRPKNPETRIKKRLDARLKQGMVKEVTSLYRQGISWKRLDDFGLEYRWISRWLKKSKFPPQRGEARPTSLGGKIPDSKFLNSDEYQSLLRDIIKYSKRQMTWFKRNPEIKWLTPSKVEGNKEAEKLVVQFLR